MPELMKTLRIGCIVEISLVVIAILVPFL